jgi:hypothetical protein
VEGEKKAKDSHRPHRFEFFMNGSAVMMRYYHWCHQKEAWNKEDIFVFNYVPDLADLKPALLREKFMNTLSTCSGACLKSVQCPRCQCMMAFDPDNADKCLHANVIDFTDRLSAEACTRKKMSSLGCAASTR